jgi:mannose-6-phosphate isomerase-like protein (cupin superfamily)
MSLFMMMVIVATGFVLSGVAADVPPRSPVLHLEADKVAAAFAKGAPLLATNNFKIQAGRRTGPGEVEVHHRDTDIFYVLEGAGTIVTGGRVIEPKDIGPGEVRAKEIVGGEEQHLSKGDIIVIPNGIPHWFTKVEGPMVYYVVKVTQ